MRLGPREQDNYEHIADLGQGAFGVVTLVKDKRIMDSQPMVNYAMKVVSSVNSAYWAVKHAYKQSCLQMIVCYQPFNSHYLWRAE